MDFSDFALAVKILCFTNLKAQKLHIADF
ncbi:MAG: hypothetical protein ACI8RD_005961, partial [Bacillariaceae sp.]